VRARGVRRLGALILAERPLAVKPNEETARLLADGVLRLGLERLARTDAARQWLARVHFLRTLEGEPWPDLSDAVLAARAGEWLAPMFSGKTSVSQVTGEDLARALRSLLPHALARRLDKEAPSHLVVPTGSQLAIDYAAEGGPALAVRVQELFGLDRHPSVGNGRVPLTLSLLSPAQRPIQVTKDLPAFWRGSWAEVRRELRGRYPKHSWPENPLAAAPTRRAKPRPKR